MKSGHKRTSRFLSLVLRHKPEAAGVTLDETGWCAVDDLLAGARQAGVSISREELAEIVATNDKQRFRLSDDGTRIRANQGHSIPVELELQEQEPPAILYHGTTTRVLETVRRDGLQKMKRHHVHLSPDVETARRVGMRHGNVVVLEVQAGAMRGDGFTFYRSENGVWLVDHVPPQYLAVSG